MKIIRVSLLGMLAISSASLMAAGGGKSAISKSQSGKAPLTRASSVNAVKNPMDEQQFNGLGGEQQESPQTTLVSQPSKGSFSFGIKDAYNRWTTKPTNAKVAPTKRTLNVDEAGSGDSAENSIDMSDDSNGNNTAGTIGRVPFAPVISINNGGQNLNIRADDSIETTSGDIIDDSNNSSPWPSSRLAPTNGPKTMAERLTQAQEDALAEIKKTSNKPRSKRDSYVPSSPKDIASRNLDTTISFLKKQSPSTLAELLVSSPRNSNDGTPIGKAQVVSAITSNMADAIGITRLRNSYGQSSTGRAIDAQVRQIGEWASSQLDTVFGPRTRGNEQSRVNQMMHGMGKQFSSLALSLGLRKPTNTESFNALPTKELTSSVDDSNLGLSSNNPLPSSPLKAQSATTDNINNSAQQSLIRADAIAQFKSFSQNYKAPKPARADNTESGSSKE